jgi:hypothetical protein
VIAQMDARFEVAVVDLQDLLVDRDGLRVEAALRELFGDLAVRFDRRSLIAAFELEIAELQTRIAVIRLSLKMVQVFLERLVVSALLDVLLRLVQRFSFERKGQGLVLASPRTGPPRRQTDCGGGSSLRKPIGATSGSS